MGVTSNKMLRRNGPVFKQNVKTTKVVVDYQGPSSVGNVVGKSEDDASSGSERLWGSLSEPEAK